ncbi:type II secretion system F family protein [bacterium]|nr:type II secretion system F family protein [bacterium]
MPIYEYTALKDNKVIVKGRIEAEDSRKARRQLADQGLIPTKIEEFGINKGAYAARRKTARKKVAAGHIPSLSLKDKIDFTQTLQILSATGISIIETLAFIENNADSRNVKRCALEIKKQIIGGGTFAETLGKYRNTFGNIYVGLVSAGEDSGELDKTLDRMLELLRKQADVKSKVSGALVYPCFILVLAVIVSIVMLGFVFPAFAEMFANLDKELPFITKACMAAGNFIKQYWYWTAAILAGVGFFIAFLFKNPVTRKIIDTIALKLPLLNELLRFSNFSNFLSVMQVAYDAGIPIVDCLYLANLTMECAVLKEAIEKASVKIHQGTQLSQALQSTGEVPKMVLFMIQTGEQSGKLGELLINAIQYIDKKLDDIIDKFTKMIEPVMMLLIGGLVMVFALALYLPLFGAYQ